MLTVLTTYLSVVSSHALHVPVALPLNIIVLAVTWLLQFHLLVAMSGLFLP